MKKLILLSLILTALVFQSCKKISNHTDEDLVLISFSQALTTKTTPNLPEGAVPFVEEFDALVLGCTSSSNWNNDWTSIYFSTEKGTDNKCYANGKISLNSNTSANTFFPQVAYPLDDKNGPDTYIYIKALAPYGAILDREDIIGKPNGPASVTFEINGKQDVMATKVLSRPDALGVPSPSTAGTGIRKDKDIDLIFERLLSKINFKIILGNDNLNAVEHWGNVLSIVFKDGYTTFDCLLANNTTEHNPSLIKDFELKESGLGKPIPFSSEPPADFGSLMVYPIKTNWKIVVTTKYKSESDIVTTITLTEELVQAKEYDITITFNENKEAGFSVKIEDWLPGKTGEGEGNKLIIPE